MLNGKLPAIGTALLLALAPVAMAGEQPEDFYLIPGADARPPVDTIIHSIGGVGITIFNLGIFGDPWESLPSMEWPTGSDNNYLWCGDVWAACYGNITPADSAARYTSTSGYNGGELNPSDGYPLVYETPGSVAPEQSEYGIDDWYEPFNDNPFGIGFFVRTCTWDDQGFDEFVVSDFTVTHHSEFGNPGVPLEGLMVSIRGDFDVSSADPVDRNMDDLVYYDGHAIWCNDPAATFEYVFDSMDPASTVDDYTYQQNPDNPLPPGDPDNIYYHYNYTGSDGIPDNDVDQNGVSDHFTILAKVVGPDTLYRTDPASGVVLFSEGMPYYHWEHTVGDTTFLVVPRNLSYMWDSDNPGVADDDSGEPLVPLYCNGFAGWRLLDVWVQKAGGGVERPCDVYGYPVPASHQWWNWESDPETDEEQYLFVWGKNPDMNGLYSGPEYMGDWVGNANAPDAIEPDNPGPFPFVFDNPIINIYPVFDYRFLQSIGLVTLADGDTLHIVGGWVIGLGLDGLRMNADLLLDAYYRESIWGQGLGMTATEPVPVSDLRIMPNPMVSGGMVKFVLSAPGRAEITVYDLSGRAVRSIMDAHVDAGEHSVQMDCSGLESGIYFARVRCGVQSVSGRFVLLD